MVRQRAILLLPPQSASVRADDRSGHPEIARSDPDLLGKTRREGLPDDRSRTRHHTDRVRAEGIHAIVRDRGDGHHDGRHVPVHQAAGTRQEEGRGQQGGGELQGCPEGRSRSHRRWGASLGGTAVQTARYPPRRHQGIELRPRILQRLPGVRGQRGGRPRDRQIRSRTSRCRPLADGPVVRLHRLRRVRESPDQGGVGPLPVRDHTPVQGRQRQDGETDHHADAPSERHARPPGPLPQRILQ